MRLLFSIPDFWPYLLRGSERIVHDLSLTLAGQGDQVTIVTRTPGPLAERRLEEGFEVKYRTSHRWLERMTGLDGLELFALDAASAGVRQRADAYHAFYLTDAYGLALASRLRRTPFIFSWHGIPDRAWWQANHPRTHRWYLRAIERAACVTVMSQVSAERMRADYGIDPVVVAPGIFVADYRNPRAPSAQPSIVCSAALDDVRKQHEVLIDAFAELAVDDPEVRLQLIGPGDATRVRALVAAKHPEVQARIRVDPPTVDLSPTYASATVGALTSRGEAFGLVVAEYLASGMPAVVSDDGGAVEIIDRGTGLAFREGDAHACARALRLALDMAADPRTEQRCRERAAAFDWSKRIHDYNRIYAGVASGA